MQCATCNIPAIQSRNQNVLPEGMAAIDANVAECVEDAYAAGHTDDTLIKLLSEAMHIPPGASIIAASLGGESSGGSGGAGTSAGLSQQQTAQMLQMQAQGLLAAPPPAAPWPMPMPAPMPAPMQASMGMNSLMLSAGSPG